MKTSTTRTVSRRSVVVDDRQREFIEVVEQRQQSGASLVIVLHGFLQSARSIRRFSGNDFDDLTANGDVVVVYPDGLRREWNGVRKAVMLSEAAKTINDVAFFRALIAHAIATHEVDPRRVFVVGFSLGGQMVMRLIHEIPELLAGATILSSSMPEPECMSLGRDAHLPLPVLLMHGTKDPLAPFWGGPAGFHGHLPKGKHLSARGTADYFAARNGISGPTSDTPIDPDVIQHDYTAPGSHPVRFIEIEGGGHVIPNRRYRTNRWVMGPTVATVTAVEAVSSFFELHHQTTDPEL